VLGCAIADELYRRFPGLPEGQLTRLRASLVRKEALAEAAAGLGLAPLLRIGGAPGGAIADSILADAVEALVGAVFVDAGYEAARAAVTRVFGALLERVDAKRVPKDAKTELQELMQARRQALPEYRVLATRGEAHARVFEVECAAAGTTTRGSGSSLQRAEQDAAHAMLEGLAK
jgi:ribonuclease-3